MKQFLVPAFLLVLVGVSAALAAGSRPQAATVSASSHCKMGTPELACPMSGGRAMGACHEAASEACPNGEAKPECDEAEEPACCKRKAQCEKDPAPVDVEK